MRASNADRERVAKVLHDAMAEGRLTVGELEERLDKVYAAKTFGELVPLTRDLPVPGGVAPPPAIPESRAVAAPHHRIGGRGTSKAAVAVMSGADRKGVWVVPPTFNAVSIMGGVEIDLTQARFEDAETTIQAFALMGSVEVWVPEDVTVRVDGVGFMGSFENKVSAEAVSGGPVVRVTGLAMMGVVEVKYRKKKKRDRKQLEC